MREARKTARWMCAALVAALLAGAAAATTLKRMNLDELAAAASVVARVKAISSEARWENGHIYTFTKFEVVETLKGSAPRQVTVRTLGGRANGKTMRVEGVPQFAPGEETYLFLEPTAFGDLGVTSWVQGTFRVHKADAPGRPGQVETVTQDTGSVSVFDPATRTFSAGGVRNMPVAEFRQRVSESVARQKAAAKIE